MIQNKKNNPIRKTSGFTIVELMVAITLFLVVISIASAVFLAGTRTQRAALGFLGVNQNVSQVFEQIERELRFAKESSIAQITYEGIQFKNPDLDRYVRYIRRVSTPQYGNNGYIDRETADDSNFSVNSTGPFFVTGDQANITDLKFYCLTDNALSPATTPLCNGDPSTSSNPPPFKILVVLTVQSVGSNPIESHFQTVITPRGD